MEWAEKHIVWLAVAGLVLLSWVRTTSGADAAVAGAKEGGMPKVVPVHLTDYHPFGPQTQASALMEGGVNDRKGNPLHTLEDFQEGRADFVSVSGDWQIFPYGQRIAISRWPDVVFRVVDTGSHFFGAKKVYRVIGEEPLDICVRNAISLNESATMTVVFGDTLDPNIASYQETNLFNLAG